MVRQLGEVCTIYTGTGFPIELQGKAKGKYPFYKVGDISRSILSGHIELGSCDNYIDDDDVRELRGAILPAGTIVFAKIGEAVKLNRRAITTCDCLVDNNVIGIKPNQNILTLRYCYHYLCRIKMEDYAVSTTVPSVKKSVLKKIEIVIPSIDEQIRVCSEINKIEELITLRKKQLQKLDDLIKSRFVEMFGDSQVNPNKWNEVSIASVIKGNASNGFFAKRDDYHENGNVSVLGVAYVVNRMYSQVLDLPKTNATQRDIQRFSVKYGDLLFCRSSLVATGIGKASIVPENVPENVLFECHVIRLPLDLTKCVPEYVQVLTTTDYYRKQIIAQSKTATMTTIGQDGILKTKILLPPIERQQKFYRLLKRIDELKVKAEQGLETLEQMKQALMQKYFG